MGGTVSITTAARLNSDQLVAQLPGGAGFSSQGAPLERAGSKTLTAIGASDAQLQAAITTAAGAFVDYDANRATLLTRASAALAANQTFLALATPTQAQAVAQVQTLTKECSALIRLLLSQLDAVSGT